MYLLDTDHCVELLRGNPKVSSKFKSLHKDTLIYTTIVTIAELFYGAHRLPDSQQRLREIDAFQRDVEILSLDLSAAKIYGRLKAELAQRGEMLADNDLFIASIALSRGLVLMTHNTQHYRRISDLSLKDWVR